jgi:hypothetical protein
VRQPPDHGNKPKTEMGFVTLLPSLTKQDTERLAASWGQVCVSSTDTLFSSTYLPCLSVWLSIHVDGVFVNIDSY